MLLFFHLDVYWQNANTLHSTNKHLNENNAECDVSCNGTIVYGPLR